MQVNTNGLLSFLGAVNQYSSQPFPFSGNKKLVAPFWSDVDTTHQGDVYYRQTTDSSILDQATQDVCNVFVNLANFQASWVLIATWYDVTFPGGSRDSLVCCHTLFRVKAMYCMGIFMVN